MQMNLTILRPVDMPGLTLTCFTSKEMLGQTSQLETAQEAAWRRLNPKLYCGQTNMKLKVMGPGAADLQLDMGISNGKAKLVRRSLFKV